jgi:hypothetical protein
MSNMAKRSGISLMQFNPAQTAGTQQSPIQKLGRSDVAPHRFLPITVGVEGSFHNVTQFLYRMSGMPKIISIDSVQMLPLDDAPAHYVRGNLQLTAYIVKQVQPQTAAAITQLKTIGAALNSYKLKRERYANLRALNAEGLITVKEGDVIQGYTFTTDPSSGKDSFKILATATDPGLHNLSIDQTGKVMDETDQEPFE